jgi:uncharacterized protein with NRDE domain
MSLECRLTKEAHWWEDPEGVLGGRDSVANGTWLCCSRKGYIAFLTNRYQGELSSQNHPNQLRSLSFIKQRPSRGELPVKCVCEGKSFLSNRLSSTSYDPFNLFFVDFSTISNPKMCYVSNAGSFGEMLRKEVPPGKIYSVSNFDGFNPETCDTNGCNGALTSSSAGKVDKITSKINNLVSCGAFDLEEFPFDDIFEAMHKEEGLETESTSSIVSQVKRSVYVRPIPLAGEGDFWGTRTTTIVAVTREGRVLYKEKSIADPRTCIWNDGVTYNFKFHSFNESNMYA